MGKLIHITGDRVKSANQKLAKILERDKGWQEELKRIENEAEDEKRRRDAEYAKQEGRKI